VARPLLGDAERPERVEHDGHLLGPLDPYGALSAPGLRAVYETRRMVRDRSDPDAGSGAAHEVACRIEQHLVAVDVGVVVRHLHRLRMEVEVARNERADHETRALEGLVHGRRLVDEPDDRLEVVDRQCVRPQTAVPPHHVERMVAVDVAAQPAGRPHDYLDIVAVDEQRLGRAAQVTLAVGRALQELSVGAEVLARRSDVAAPGLDHEHLGGAFVDHPSVGRRRGHDDVVAGRDVERPERRLEPRPTRLNERHLVTERCAVQRARRAGAGDGDGHVTVGEEHVATGDEVGPGRNVGGAEVAGNERVIGPCTLPLRGAWVVGRLDGDDRTR
jgi:hypothetical protein